MTTVTIDRKLLKEVLAVLEKSSCAVGYESETAWLNANSKIRAALAAPVTAPAGQLRSREHREFARMGLD